MAWNMFYTQIFPDRDFVLWVSTDDFSGDFDSSAKDLCLPWTNHGANGRRYYTWLSLGCGIALWLCGGIVGLLSKSLRAVPMCLLPHSIFVIWRKSPNTALASGIFRLVTGFLEDTLEKMWTTWPFCSPDTSDSFCLAWNLAILSTCLPDLLLLQMAPLLGLKPCQHLWYFHGPHNLTLLLLQPHGSPLCPLFHSQDHHSSLLPHNLLSRRKLWSCHCPDSK